LHRERLTAILSTGKATDTTSFQGLQRAAARVFQ